MSKKKWTSRSLTSIETILQHEGFVFTFSWLYILSNCIFFLFGAAPEWRHFEGSSVFMRIIRASARGGGALLNFNSALIVIVASRVFMSVLRRTPLNMVVPFDKAMPHFHAYVGITLSIATFLHGIPHLINYGFNDLTEKGIHGHTSLAISGTILCVIVGVMRMTTFKTIRKVISYEAFYITHIVGFTLYFSLVILHGSNHGRFSTYKFVAGPLIIYAIDIVWRRCRTRRKCELVPGVSARTVGEKMVRLEMPRTFWYLPGQYCYIKIPVVSRYQWHPFSMASSPNEGTIVFYVKVVGDWTKALYKVCKETSDPRDPFYIKIDVHLRGPFGAPAQHVGQYEHVILVGGGVGSTPFTSITKFAHYYFMNHTNRGRDILHSAHDAFRRYVTVHNNMVGNIPRWDQDLEHDLEPPPEPIQAPPIAARTPASIAFRKTFHGKGHKSWARMTFTNLKKNLFPPDYNAHLGDPNGPIPARPDVDYGLGNPHAPIPVRKKLSQQPSQISTSGREATSRRKENDYEFPEAHDDDGVILEDQIMDEQINVSSRQIDLVGADGALRHLPRSGERSSHTDYEMTGLASWKDRLLIYLHSVTLNWILLWIMMARFAIVAIGRATLAFHLKQLGLNVYDNNVLNIIDLILSLVLFLPILATVLAEMFIYGSLDFFRKNVGNGFDLLVLTPLTFLCVLLHALALANIGKNVRHIPNIIVLIVWPVVSALLLWRIIRTIGNRVALAKYMTSRFSHTKSLDFLWMCPTVKDDSWIVEELLAVAKSDCVRIHRFITRDEEQLEEWALNRTKIPFTTTYSRPKWSEVFDNLVENSKSGSSVGVFLCGNDSIVRSVQAAAMHAMEKSIKNALQRGYNEKQERRHRHNSSLAASGSCADAVRSQNLYHEAAGAAAYGCNIRISVRVENFN